MVGRKLLLSLVVSVVLMAIGSDAPTATSLHCSGFPGMQLCLEPDLLEVAQPGDFVLLTGTIISQSNALLVDQISLTPLANPGDLDCDLLLPAFLGFGQPLFCTAFVQIDGAPGDVTSFSFSAGGLDLGLGQPVSGQQNLDVGIAAPEFTCSIDVTKTGPAQAYVGESIQYNFGVENTSPPTPDDIVSEECPSLQLQGFTDTVLGDLLPAALANGCDPLPVGGTCGFSVPYTTQVGDPDPLLNAVAVNYQPEGHPNISVNGTANHSLGLLPTADIDLVEINKGQPARAVECAAPGAGNNVHPANGRGLAHDPDHNQLYYTEDDFNSAPWATIYRVDPSNAQPMGGAPQVCNLLDSCPVIFPDLPCFCAENLAPLPGSMPIGAMAYMDRNDFNPPAPTDVLWVAPLDGSGFGGPGDIYQIPIDTDGPDPFAPSRNADGHCVPTLVSFAPLGRSEQCPLPPNVEPGFPDGMDFDPSPDRPGTYSIWVSDQISDLVNRLSFPEDPALSYLTLTGGPIDVFSIHKCNTGIAVDPTGGNNPVWLTEFALDFRDIHLEEVFLSQRSRAGLNPRVFEAAAYDMGLFGAHPDDLGIKNARAWEDSEFDETQSFAGLGHRCGVWTVDDSTTVLRSGTQIPSNELTFVRFDVPCGQDETDNLPIGLRDTISMTKKIHNNGPEDPVNVEFKETVNIPEGCDATYLTQIDTDEVTVASGVSYFELLPGGTVVPLGVGPVALAPGAGRRIGAVGQAGVDPELTVVAELNPNGVPVDVPVNFHQEFDKHCIQPGTKTFEFCIEARSPGNVDPNPNNDTGCVTEVVDVPAICEDPDPRQQGHWHRQCLGVPENEGGIDPGRRGRGPTSPTEPGFVDTLMPCADNRLEAIGLFGTTTCEGMDADPPSETCQRAEKKLTSLILNVCSGRLSDSCPVDVANHGCTSTNVGDLIAEIGSLIQSGDCQTAHQCAGPVNDGAALTSTASQWEGTDLTKAVPPPAEKTAGTTLEESENQDNLPLFRSSMAQHGTASEEPTASVSISILESEGGHRDPSASSALPRKNHASEVGFDMAALTLEQQMIVFGSGNTSEANRRMAEDALFDALAGGYEPAKRLEVARVLLGKVDVALHSLLAEHLLDILNEVREVGNEKIVKEAGQLLERIRSHEAESLK